MSKLMPKMYQKDIFSIDYKKLKEKYHIKVLIFDFDNTIIEHKNNLLNKKTKKFIKDLQKDFLIYVVSNSFNKKKLNNICNELELPYIGASMKPFSIGYRKIKLKSVKPNEIATIGDQLITDVLGSNRRGYFSILIDPIREDNEIIFTKINRKIEMMFLKRLTVKRGGYFD